MKWVLVLVMAFLLGCNLGEASWNYKHGITDLSAPIIAISLIIICSYIGFEYLFN